MQLYRVTSRHAMDGTCYEWCGTKADAAAAAKKAKDDFEVESVMWEPVEVPTDKPGLMRWLNVHLSRDNG
jgi:hypothetical protein